MQQQRRTCLIDLADNTGSILLAYRIDSRRRHMLKNYIKPLNAYFLTPYSPTPYFLTPYSL